MSATRTADELRAAVRDRYGEIAGTGGGCCGRGGCCSPGTETTGADRFGYVADDLEAAPHGADLGLGCGNPHAIASLQAGETVVDLGSGAGLLHQAGQAAPESGVRVDFSVLRGQKFTLAPLIICSTRIGITRHGSVRRRMQLENPRGMFRVNFSMLESPKSLLRPYLLQLRLTVVSTCLTVFVGLYRSL